MSAIKQKRIIDVWIFNPSLRRGKYWPIEVYRRLLHDKPSEWRGYVSATLTLDAPKPKPRKTR